MELQEARATRACRASGQRGFNHPNTFDSFRSPSRYRVFGHAHKATRPQDHKAEHKTLPRSLGASHQGCQSESVNQIQLFIHSSPTSHRTPRATRRDTSLAHFTGICRIQNYPCPQTIVRLRCYTVGPGPDLTVKDACSQLQVVRKEAEISKLFNSMHPHAIRSSAGLARGLSRAPVTSFFLPPPPRIVPPPPRLARWFCILFAH